jgi:hypothetical protein
VNKKYSTVPEHARPVMRLEDRTANGLTKAILVYFDFKGIKAWRQASEGRFIQGRTFMNETVGRTMQEKGKYIPRSKAAKGSGDVTCILPPLGRRMDLEVKIGRDRQSDDQKKFQREIEAMGGIYILVRTWDDFIQQIKQYVK